MKRKKREEEAPQQEGTPQKEETSSKETQKKERKKEQKIVYIDDGSQIADMSGTRRHGNVPRQKSTAREKIRTYFAVVRRMLIPMLCTLFAFALVFVILLAITGKF